MCTRDLAEIDDQVNSGKALQKTLEETYKSLDQQRKAIAAKCKTVNNCKDDTVKLYGEGIESLKHYELHDRLKESGKTHLIDIYYKEKAMNNFRDSCIASLFKVS